MSTDDGTLTLTRRDFLRLAAGAGVAVGGMGLIRVFGDSAEAGAANWAGNVTGDVVRIPSMCQGCTTACGIVATVKDGRLVNVAGNPEDPNSRGAVCAKGTAGPSILYDPYRLLYPMKRVGARGEGKWRRISWDEAYTEIAEALRAIRERGHPEEFAFQQGRNRSGDAISRFLRAYGTPSHFNHRALCSSNRRGAILATIGEAQWDLGDYEHSRFVLNFGSNWAEAHQGHIPVAIRMMKGRENGAKIVTFEARLSNTAALSDEWFCVKPGTDGLIALAMSNVICSEELWDKEWFDTWSNYPADDYARHVSQYTPEMAAEASGVPAEEIRRIAREFAAAAPRATTVCNRGSHAHRNGFYNDRAITLLNALVGSMGQPGGWCWHPLGSWDKEAIPEPEPVPPAPTATSAIAEARDWPLANSLGADMRVGEIVYRWIADGKQKISALMTYNTNQAWAWPEKELVQEVLADEDLVPFHFFLDCSYTETAHLADIVLPWTTWLERWDIDARPPQHLVDYVGLRQPVVPPLGESKDVRDIFPELARRIGGGMERYYPWATTEEYLEEFFAPVPGGFDYMREHGAWQDPSKEPNYRPYERELTAGELGGTVVDPDTDLIYLEEEYGEDGAEPIGIMMDGVARRGFDTPSRKVEVHNSFIVEQGRTADRDIHPLPIYLPIPDHAAGFADDELIMISFKWNVHNAHRSMQSKWLQEIVHSNPAWLNPRTAERLGLAQGDRIRVTSFRPRDRDVPDGDGSQLGTLETRVHLTEGVHPAVIAISHNAGLTQGGPIASAAGGVTDVPGWGTVADPDVERVWWNDRLSVAQNSLVPIYPDPTTGQQAFNDTRVRIEKVA